VSPELARVKRAASRRVSISQEYRAAIRAARDEGHSLREIAKAAGVSHVAVLKLLRD
jgi:DNA-directed RNA polymerase specialized sigma24 family protein